MALQPLTNVYNGGAVKLDSRPEVNFYAQLLAKQQAKKDALDQYYSKALTDVTPAGMRNKDVTGGWAKKLNEWQEFGMNPDNRKKLLNPRLDNYKTLTEFNQRHADLIQDAERSKRELADEKLISQHQLSGKWNPTESDINVAHRKGLSIYDASRLDDEGNEPDITQFSFNVPEFTPLQEAQLYKAASQNIQKSKIPDETKRRIDNTTGYIYTPYSENFNPTQVKTIADNYANFLTKPALIKYENLMHDPATYEAANKAYQSVYSSNEIIDTPQKMAKAIAITHAVAETKTGEDKVIDPAQRQRLAIERIKLSSDLALGRSEALHDLAKADKKEASLWIDDYVNSLPSKSEGDFNYKVAAANKWEVGKKIPLSPVLEKALTIDGKTTADFLFLTPDGNYRYGIYERNKNNEIVKDKEGKTYEINKDRTRTISPGDLKLAIGKQAGVTQMNKEMSGNKQSYNYKGQTYTQAQIEAAAKQSGRTVQEYLKELGIKQ